MKKTTTLSLILLATINFAWSHALWLTTTPTGKVNSEQEIKVLFGEYSYGIIEKVNSEAFNKVKNYNIWIITPNGEKQLLKATPKDNYYSIKYTPKQKGTYTVQLDNDNIDVIDYSAYDFGIIKTHYHSTTKFVVGKTVKNTKASNKNGLVIQDISNRSDSLKLKIEYKGSALKSSKVEISISDKWSKEVYTNEKGEITINLPWDINYFIEVTKKEETPGQYKGEEYEFIWHCATYLTQK